MAEHGGELLDLAAASAAAIKMPMIHPIVSVRTAASLSMLLHTHVTSNFSLSLFTRMAYHKPILPLPLIPERQNPRMILKPDTPYSALLAALSLIAFEFTMIRRWDPSPHLPFSSFTSISNHIFRRSMLRSFAVAVTFIPTGVGARWRQ